MKYTIIKSNIKHTYIQIKDGKVIVKAPKRMTNKQIEEIVAKQKKWIEINLKKEQKMRDELKNPVTQEEQNYLKTVVTKSIEKYARNVGEVPNKVTIKEMKSAWGSCTGNRNISINSRLAKKEEKLIEYVVLHEICHLKHMNHSKEFWKLVEKNMKDYKMCRKLLKQ